MFGGDAMAEQEKLVFSESDFSGMYVSENDDKAFTIQECNCCQTCKE